MSQSIVDAYLTAFCQKDAGAIATLLTEDVALQDPIAGRVEGLGKVMTIFRGIFAAGTLDLVRKQTYASAEGGIAVEFALTVTDAAGARTELEGVDLFAFRGGKICNLRAYVETIGARGG